MSFSKNLMQQNNFLNNAFLHHLSIQCADPKSLSSFYSETLGMNSANLSPGKKQVVVLWK